MSADRPDADIAIIGGGMAGMALAARLAARSRLRIVVLEPRETVSDTRAWRFFRPARHEFSCLVTHAWPRWRVSSAHETVHGEADGQVLQSVPAARYHAAAEAALSASPEARIERGVRVDALHASHDRVVIETPFGALTARQAIDTRPPSPRALARAPLMQESAGALVTLDRPLLDPATAGLMDAMTGGPDALGFIQFLPLDPFTAHVEYTRFAARPAGAAAMDAGLAEALAYALDGEPHRTGPRERAVIPLGLSRRRHRGSRLIAQARAGGGGMRGATGYGFLKAQVWAEACAARIARGGRAVSMPPDPLVRRRLEALFLNAVRNHPEEAAGYVMALARSMPSASFIRFVTGEAGPLDHARALAALPALRLLEAAPAALTGFVPRMRIAVPV
ncbi:FAD-dependent oxidoreductase [Glycocaulis profundi]|nr:FAD-dependent oxidoreductase [Glycocaulis profundi]